MEHFPEVAHVNLAVGLELVQQRLFHVVHLLLLYAGLLDAFDEIRLLLLLGLLAEFRDHQHGLFGLWLLLFEACLAQVMLALVRATIPLVLSVHEHSLGVRDGAVALVANDGAAVGIVLGHDEALFHVVLVGALVFGLRQDFYFGLDDLVLDGLVQLFGLTVSQDVVALLAHVLVAVFCTSVELVLSVGELRDFDCVVAHIAVDAAHAVAVGLFEAFLELVLVGAAAHVLGLLIDGDFLLSGALGF